MGLQNIKHRLSNFFKVGIYAYYGLLFIICILYVSKMSYRLDGSINQTFMIYVVIALIISIVLSSYFYYYHLRSWSNLMITLQLILCSIVVVMLFEVYLTQVQTVRDNGAFTRFIYSIIIAIFTIQYFFVFLNFRYDGYKFIAYKLYFSMSILVSQTALLLLGVSLVMYNIPFGALILAVLLFLVSGILMMVAKPAAKLDVQADISKVKLMDFKFAPFTIILPLLLYFSDLINLGYFVVTSMYIVFYTVFIVTIRPVLISDEKVQLQVREQEDLTDRIDKKRRAFETANHELIIQSRTDVLTGLKNRNIFYHDLSALKASNTPFSLIYVDLDRFKFINDLHGHNTGDLLLIAVTSRLAETAHGIANLYRIGGDEFAVTFNKVDRDSVTELCEHIIRIFDMPFIIKNYEFHLSASVGVARFPEDTQSEKELLTFADIAMYQAKQYDRQNKYHVFSADLQSENDRKSYVARLLKLANINEDFTVFYQPLWRADDTTVVGCEALIRWFHPDEGLISPAEFIPIAEEIGVINELTFWVIQTVIKQLKKWKSHLPVEFKMGINLSPVVLNDINFDQMIMELLSQTEIDPSFIDIEITENSDMTTNSAMDRLYMTLFKSNISVSIDDFGTGYSSLNYIKKFDIDTIKIAKELVDNIADNEDERTLVKAIVMMTKGLHLETVAEGVETEAQLKILQDFGCDRIQGYLLGMPANPKDFEKKYLGIVTEV